MYDSDVIGFLNEITYPVTENYKMSENVLSDHDVRTFLNSVTSRVSTKIADISLTTENVLSDDQMRALLNSVSSTVSTKPSDIPLPTENVISDHDVRANLNSLTGTISTKIADIAHANKDETAEFNIYIISIGSVLGLLLLIIVIVILFKFCKKVYSFVMLFSFILPF